MNWYPAHWAFRGPQRRPADASRLLRDANVGGGHVSTLRRLIRIGPVGIYAMRYRPGMAEEAKEWIP